jgi:MFS family permease
METKRIVGRYYAYRATTSIGFYIPVGVVFLAEVRGFGFDAIGLIMAAYLVGMLVGEVPTGYLGDRLGRRASLAVGNALMSTSLVAWALLQTPLEYALLNVLWAVGTTFRSGTADAWLYDLLATRDAADEFARVSGRASTVSLVVSAGAAVASGGLVAVDWTAPFYANAALAALGLPILASLPAVDHGTDDVFTVRDAVTTLRLQVGRPEVRWFVAYAALFYGLFQVALAFEQLALREVGVSVGGLGVLYAGFKLVSAGAASTAGPLEERLGARGVFGLYAPVIGVAFAAVAVWPLLLVPVLFLNRGLTAVTTPIRNQYLNDRLAGVGRATVLSGASMVLSLVAATADVVGGVVAESTGPVTFLVGAGIATAGAAGVLWLAVSPVRPLATPAPADEPAVEGAD